MATGRGGEEFFWNICFEMMHFGAKVTNALYYHWVSGVTVKSLTFKNDQLFLLYFMGG